MAYKKTKAVEAIDEAITRFVSGMKLAGKPVERIYLTTKQIDLLIADLNKRLKDENKDAKEVRQMREYRGYEVKIYNP